MKALKKSSEILCFSVWKTSNRTFIRACRLHESHRLWSEFVKAAASCGFLFALYNPGLISLIFSYEQSEQNEELADKWTRTGTLRGGEKGLGFAGVIHFQQGCCRALGNGRTMTISLLGVIEGVSLAHY